MYSIRVPFFNKVVHVDLPKTGNFMSLSKKLEEKAVVIDYCGLSKLVFEMDITFNFIWK